MKKALRNKPLGQSGGKRTIKKLVIDHSKPSSDMIWDEPSFEHFLTERLKINGKPFPTSKTNSIVVGPTQTKITCEYDISKRYLKYLLKKFLKKERLRDFMCIVSSARHTLKLKYFKDTKAKSAAKNKE